MAGHRFNVAASAILCCLWLGSGGCEVRPIVRTIADDVHLDDAWTELHADPPLEVQRRIQTISIGIPNVADWGIRPDSASFVTPDGSTIKIDVELVAEDGRRFHLDSVGLGPGLTFTRVPEDMDGDEPSLPADARFPIVRVRSDTPLAGGPVQWICITNF